MKKNYHWWVFGVAFLTLLGAAGFRSTPAILIDPAKLSMVDYAPRPLGLSFLDPVLGTCGVCLAGFMVFYGLGWRLLVLVDCVDLSQSWSVLARLSG